MWFASLLRGGFALSAAGSTERFSVIAEGALPAGPVADLHAAGEHVTGGFLELPVRPDVAGGGSALSVSGASLITLPNGSAAEGLFASPRICGHSERPLSVDHAGRWELSPSAYGTRPCSADPAPMVVAVRPWDTGGAKRSGMRTAWLNRRGQRYPSRFLVPDRSVATSVGACRLRR